jgi:uncharacterized membrane protein
LKTDSILFPNDDRDFKGQRWVNITLRTLHLIGVAGIGGAFLYQVPRATVMPYLVLSVASGFGLMGLGIWTNGIWLIQLRGIAILVKLMLLLCVLVFPGVKLVVLIGVIIISGIIAHAPGDVRYYSIFHGRRIDEVN